MRSQHQPRGAFDNEFDFAKTGDNRVFNVGEINIFDIQESRRVWITLEIISLEISVCVDVVSDGLWVGVVCDDVSPASGVGFGEFGGRGDCDISSPFWEGGFSEGEDVVEMVQVGGVGGVLHSGGGDGFFWCELDAGEGIGAASHGDDRRRRGCEHGSSR